MNHQMRSLFAAGCAMAVAIAVAPSRTAAQAGAAAAGASQLPPAAQRAGNLPLRTVPCSYTPCGKRVSPQDGIVWQLKPTDSTTSVSPSQRASPMPL